MPPLGSSPGPKIGVSGGTGDPREARVVDADAVEENRFTGWGAMGPVLAVRILLSLHC
jgi:hypothetical protein